MSTSTGASWIDSRHSNKPSRLSTTRSIRWAAPRAHRRATMHRGATWEGPSSCDSRCGKRLASGPARRRRFGLEREERLELVLGDRTLVDDESAKDSELVLALGQLLIELAGRERALDARVHRVGERTRIDARATDHGLGILRRHVEREHGRTV